MSRKKVLTLSGGGVRGIVTAIWLKNIEKELKRLGYIQKDLFHYFDCISGASAGSILATGLCLPKPFSLSEMVEMFESLASKIFEDFWVWNKVRYGCSYDVKKTHDVLSSDTIFGNTKLGDCKNLVITIFSMHERRHDTNTCTPVYANTFNPDSPRSYAELLEMKVADLVTGSSAAPFYFRPWRFQHNGSWHKYRDGGMVDNTGIFGAVASLCCQVNNAETQVKDLDILSLSNGGGYFFEDATCEPGRWETWRNIEMIRGTIVQGGESVAHETLRSLLWPDHMRHVNPKCAPHVPMDDDKKVNLLKDEAEKIEFQETIDWIKKSILD